MTWKDWLIIGGALSTIAAAGWGLGDAYGFRPALKSEVLAVDERVETVGQSVAWLNLINFENILKRGGHLTRRECAEYRNLAKRLGVQPLPC